MADVSAGELEAGELLPPPLPVPEDGAPDNSFEAGEIHAGGWAQPRRSIATRRPPLEGRASAVSVGESRVAGNWPVALGGSLLGSWGQDFEHAQECAQLIGPEAGDHRILGEDDGSDGFDAEAAEAALADMASEGEERTIPWSPAAVSTTFVPEFAATGNSYRGTLAGLDQELASEGEIEGNLETYDSGSEGEM